MPFVLICPACETQLVLTFHDWANNLSQHSQVDALLLDFSKAFDEVSRTKITTFVL